MSKTTLFNTRFWTDAYIADLDPSEKLLFAYCFTSSFLSISGIYEVPLKYIASETGLDRDMVEKILGRFERDGKIVYRKGWLAILKYPKYQSYNLPAVIKGLETELKSIPLEILSFIVDSGYAFDSLPKSLAIDWQSIANKDRDKGKDRDKVIRDRGVGEEIEAPKKKSGYSDEFEAFWKAYPKKVGKKNAYDQWKKLKPAEHEEIMADIPKRERDDKWLNGYVKDPERYLKNRQWEDDIIPPRQAKIIKNDTGGNTNRFAGVGTKA